jgi:hypothetical protein
MSKNRKKTTNFYLEESVTDKIDEITENNRPISKNYHGQRIVDLGLKAYLKELKKG